MTNYHIARDFGEMQYNLILLELQSLSTEDNVTKLQHYYNEFKAITKVSNEHPEIMQSKYMPLLFAYQKLFNFKGGCAPKIRGLDINVDTTEIEKEIIRYLKEKAKSEKKEKKENKECCNTLKGDL